MKYVKIPRHIDATAQIFFWEIDEFMILATCMGAGVMFGGINTLIGLLIGILGAGQFKKYKAGGLPGQLNHLAHWKNIINLNAVHIRSGERRLFK